MKINLTRGGTTSFICTSCGATVEIINSMIDDDFIPRCKSCNHIKMIKCAAV